MATQTKEHETKVEPPKGKPEEVKAEEVKAENPVLALVKDEEAKPPEPGSWQAAFIKLAEELEGTGNQWLGRIFRGVASPLVEEKPPKENATKTK